MSNLTKSTFHKHSTNSSTHQLAFCMAGSSSVLPTPRQHFGTRQEHISKPLKRTSLKRTKHLEADEVWFVKLLYAQNASLPALKLREWHVLPFNASRSTCSVQSSWIHWNIIETTVRICRLWYLPKWFRSLSNWQKDPFECRVNVLEFWAQLPCQYAGLQATPTRCYCSSGGRIAEGKLLLDGEGRLNTALLAEAKNWKYKMPLRYNWYTPTWRRDPPALIDRRHLRQSILWLYRLSASIISKFSLFPTFSDPCQP